MSNQSKNHAYRYLAKTPSVQVGDLILGGVVAYVLQPGDFGYGGSITGFITTVAQPTRYNVYGTIAWSGATSLALTYAKINTDLIAPANGAGNIGLYAQADTTSGYTDWQVPTRDELTKMYLNRVVIGNFYTLISENHYYWTSSENGTSAHVRSFYTGATQLAGKTSFASIRLIRYF